jgi:PAS domain S-box-containing protein
MAPEAIEQHLRRLAEQSREHAFILLDREQIVQWFSPGAEHIFGWPAAEITGRSIERLFTPEDAAAGIPANERDVAVRQSAAEDDRWQLRRDGTRFWASGVLFALRDERGELAGFAKLLRDRTDVREQHETLGNRVAALAAESHQKDVFLSTLSHELRNPLAPLANALEIIRLSGPTTPHVAYALSVIERQTELLRRLVDDLLDMARIGAGKVQIRREPVVLGELLERSIETLRAQIEARRHHVDLIQPETAIRVEADPARLMQVFVNLVGNAVKYTSDGGRIWVKATTEGGEAVVRVADQGLGIPPEMLPRIFELFTQVESSRPYAQGGLGIGLSVVKNLVDLHGGSVQVRSEGLGKGSEFTVRLPLMPSPPSS